MRIGRRWRRVLIGVAIVVVLALVYGAMTSRGCNEDHTPPESVPFEALPDESDPEPLSNGDDTPETSDASDDDEAAPDPPADTPRPSPAAGNGKPKFRTGSSIASCCAGLAAMSRNNTTRAGNTKLNQAAGMCYGIDKVVRAGRTSRTAALRQVRAVAGPNVPAACR